MFGFLADRTGRYWLTIIVGYTINLIAVPALALAGNLPMAAALVIAERAGRAMRKPPVEAMLSYSGGHIGHGWAFGLYEALDQAGATLGPLVMSLILLMNGSYRLGYSLLLVSAILSMTTLFVARHYFPKPHDLEKPVGLSAKGYGSSYWLYMAAAGCIAAGYADFALIGYHLQEGSIVSTDFIPIFYAIAMGVGSIP